jgi:hypothetical protein
MSIFSDVAQIRRDLADVKARQAAALADLTYVKMVLVNLGADAGEAVALLERIAEAVDPTVVGIRIVPGVPTLKETDMAKMTVKKKSSLKGAPPAKAGPGKPAGAPGDFILIDNEDDTCTVQGADAAGNPVDISGVATITATSDNPAILTVDPPQGMTFAMHAAGPLGGATVSVVATWNDGSVGPFTASLPVDVQAGGATGLRIVPGIPTVRA